VLSLYGTAQNRDGSPVWEEHPEFVVPGRDGQRARTYFSPWGWPGYLPGGFAEFTIERLVDARQRTGLDGLWMDSYSSASHLLTTEPFALSVHQADALLPWQAALEAAGFYTYCEGSPHAIGYPSTSGWRPPEDPSRVRPETYYKFGLYLQQAYVDQVGSVARFLADAEMRWYYRFLANRCCPILDMGHFGQDTASIELIAQANHDFNAVSDLMVTRRLLAAGVEWSAEAGRAVFAFEDMRYPVPEGTAVRDVTEGRDLAGRNGKVRLEAYHTYRVTDDR